MDPHELVGELIQLEKFLRQIFRACLLIGLIPLKEKFMHLAFILQAWNICQDSRIIRDSLSEVFLQQPKLKPQDFDQMSELEQVESLFSAEGSVNLTKISDPVIKDTLESLSTIREIQKANGVHACHRYIISNCRGAIDR